jgi:DNA uptake protein ComE-like DNA-binding protein
MKTALPPVEICGRRISSPTDLRVARPESAKGVCSRATPFADSGRATQSLRKLPTTRPGIILIAVLIVIVLLSLAAYSWSHWMLREYQGATVHGRLIQARALSDSGLEKVKLFLAQDEATQQESGGRFDNPTHFQAGLVVDSDLDRERGRFSVMARAIDSNGAFAGARFGLEDESTRLNVNALALADETVENGGRMLLMGLPGMTEDVADAILDWIDSDEVPREFGAEAGDYASMGYAPPNASLQTVEELLRVRGVTPQLLFGADVNRNGIIDASEESAAGAFEGIDPDGGAALGWSAYLTLYSQEKNVRADGTPRINLNGSDLEKLYDELVAVFPKEWATFIIAYRQNGPYRGSNESKPGATGDLDLTQPAKFKIAQVLDLVGARVQVQFAGGDLDPARKEGEGEGEGEGEDRIVLDSPFPNDPIGFGLYLPKLMENVTINSAKSIPGRVNINQAPRAILMGIPGMTEEIVENIISNRSPEPSDDNPGRRHETWILQEAIVTLDEMKALMPYVSAGGSVFRGQIVGYFDQQGPAARVEFVIDATAALPRVLFYREMSHLGRGYPLEMLGIELRE